MTQTSLPSLLRRYPLGSFFVLAFLLNGLCWWPRAYLSHHAGDSLLLTSLHLLGAFAPCAAALIVSAAMEGRAGVGRLFGLYNRWRVGAGWYAFVLLARPLIWLAALALYALAGQLPSAHGVTDWGFFAVYLLSQLLVVGVGEELGWAGFAQPRMQARWGFWSGTLLLGVLWAVWHAPMFFTAGDSQYGSSLLLFAFKLTTFRLLFSLAFQRTGSLLLPALFHVSFNALTELVPLSPNDPLALGLSLVVATGVLIWFNRQPVTKPVPLQV